MAKSRKPSRQKKIRPHYYVFCEGKTEESYVCFLRSKYRIPIDIVSKIAGCDISDRYISSYKRNKPTHKKDIDFLMYDGDVPEILDKLNRIDSATLLISTPSIELWFLLHYKNQTAEISEANCIKQLENRNQNTYKKGFIDKKLKEKLDARINSACDRAEGLEALSNPSSNIYEFIEVLKNE